MKFARLALAVVALSIAAACSSDVTGPTSSKPNASCIGGYGANDPANPCTIDP